MSRTKVIFLAAALFSFILLISCGGFRSAAAESKKKQESSQVSSTAVTDSVFPPQNISGIIQWGEGGGTDELMRPLAALAEKELGVPMLVENMSGGAGAIAMQYVYDQAPDGSTLLMGAENPALYRELGILDLTYQNFECVLLIGDETTAVTVGKNAPYSSLRELCKAAEAGKEITMATTGTGGLPWEVGAMLNGITGVSFDQIQYDSDASALAAVLHGECDFTVCKLQACLPDYRNGDLELLCMISDTASEQAPEVRPVTEEYPEFAQYLPWGPFYGVFVREGTDKERTERLSEAFRKAFLDPDYQGLLKERGVNPMGLTGAEAEKYLVSWHTNTVDALRKAGAVVP